MSGPLVTVMRRGASIFESYCRALINPVNCVGVMGAGLAKEFKKIYPSMFLQYRKICKAGKLCVGKPVLCWPEYQHSESVILFPTKGHWSEKSKIEYVETGLVHIGSQILNKHRGCGIDSVAIPALGCGNGGLEWSQVLPVILNGVKGWGVEKIEVYPPW